MQHAALQILKSISEVIATSNRLDSALSDIVKILADNLNVEVCSIYVYNNESNLLELAATSGLNKSSIGEISLKPGEGITGSAYICDEIINLASAEKDEHFQYFPHSGEDKYNSFLASPLIIGNKRVGVLNLQRVIKEKFPYVVIDMVKTLSTQVANLVLSSQMLSALSSEENDTKIIDGIPSQIMVKGVSANSGIAKGNATIYRSIESFDGIKSTTDLSIEDEMKLFEQSIILAKKETLELEETAISMISEADASIFDVHAMFLEDKSLMNAIKQLILRKYSVEYAIKQVNALYQNKFKKMKEEIFREKGIDLKDIMLRILKHVKSLKNREDKSNNSLDNSENYIIIAKELLPSEIFRLNSSKLLGIVLEKGSQTSHLAILAKALNIPTLLGVKDLLTKVKNEDFLIIDCNTNICYINPNEEIATKYENIINSEDPNSKREVSSVVKSKDDHEIALRGNISLVSELPLLKQFGAKGIGLYRTEFLYMIRDYLPSEDLQFEVFSLIMNGTKDEVTFRLLDIGGDKPLSYLKFPEETNPALGERGIRLLLKRNDILYPHVKAILKASTLGNIKILVPMVSGVSEIIKFKRVIAESINNLKNKGFLDDMNYKLGIMLEIPSAFFQLEQIIKHIDCVSIGTNDLFQYTFASDRDESHLDHVAPEYLEPAFLQMIADAAKIVNNNQDKEISLCGEMAGDPLVAPLLIGAGIYDLSMESSKIPIVKDTISNFSIQECKTLLQRAIKMDNANDVLTMLQQL